MQEHDDSRGPDWFYLDKELEQFYKNILTVSDYKEPKNIALYSLWVEGVGSGIIVMIAVKSVDDGLTALNWFLGPLNMHAELLCNTKETIANAYKIDALKVVLDKYKYTGNVEFPGSDKLYRYSRWMQELICD